MPKDYMDRFYGALRTYRFQTQPDEMKDEDDCNVSSFFNEEDLELFEDWMKFVHENAYESELREEEINDSLHINIWNHKQLYHLHKHRHNLLKFLETMCKFEGKLPGHISFY